MFPKYVLTFHEVYEPVSSFVTKFGGQPVWSFSGKACELTRAFMSDRVEPKIDTWHVMRNELLDWFAREGLLLQSISASEDLSDPEMKVVVRAPIIALSRHHDDYRECLDPLAFGYPADCLEMMNLDDFNQFVSQWFERAVEAGLGRCFVCNKLLDTSGEKPWDAVFVSKEWFCWLLVHFDCKRYLSRDLKGRNPFEVPLQQPEFFDLRLA